MPRNFLVAIVLCSSLVAHAQYIPVACDSLALPPESTREFLTLIGDKKIIGVGEATHGTHEFFVAKAEVIKILVQQADFRVLVFETGFDAYQVNEYLTGKSDNLASFMSSFYLIYHTREFIDLLQWLRAYNLSVPEEKRVIVYGCDTQHIGNLVSMTKDFLLQVDPVYIHEAESKLLELTGKLSSRKRAQYLSNIESVIQRFNERKDLYLKHTSERKFHFAMKVLDAMKNAVNQSTLMNDHGTKAQSLRDEAMLENIKWIMKNESNTKIILWGHNGHIQKVNFNLKKKDHFRLGTGLHQEFGPAYYAIGFDFDKGSFNAVNYQNGARMQACKVTNENPASFSARFSHVKASCYYVDFKSLSGSDQEKLNNATCMRESGVGFSGEEFTFVNLRIKDAFDGMFFIKNTTPTVFVDARKLTQ